MRPDSELTVALSLLFQFTHPGRGATPSSLVSTDTPPRFNSRTPGGVRHLLRCRSVVDEAVSIHAPREGCDGDRDTHLEIDEVSIHAPREGCDFWAFFRSSSSFLFQFTHPGRGATSVAFHSALSSRFQFTHPGRGATWRQPYIVWGYRRFQFTHPGRGATHTREQHASGQGVSIHAPREGCDLESRVPDTTLYGFQFTHPGRGATAPPAIAARGKSGFNSRTPGGVRLSWSSS